MHVIDFEINLRFLIEPFFPHDQKVKTKLKILRMKKAFKVIWKAFFIIFKGLSLKQTKQFFLKGESPVLKGFLCLMLKTLVSYEIFCDNLRSKPVLLFQFSDLHIPFFFPNKCSLTFCFIVSDNMCDAWPFHDGGSYHIETSLWNSYAKQWTGFYMIGTPH